MADRRGLGSLRHHVVGLPSRQQGLLSKLSYGDPSTTNFPRPVSLETEPSKATPAGGSQALHDASGR